MTYVREPAQACYDTALFVANARSKCLHASDCPVAWEMNPCNFIAFHEIHEALAQGYHECSYCLGGYYRPHHDMRSLKKVISEQCFGACVCCAETRGVQRAHVVPRRLGGIDVIPLCPSCHWNYDHGLLKPHEYIHVKTHLKKNAPHLARQFTDVYRRIAR